RVRYHRRTRVFLPRPVDISLAWLIAGFILIIVELVTGTFYLLVLAIAALVGAGVGYASGALVWQAIGAAIVAVAGVVWVHRYRQALSPKRMQGLDFGQPAAFDSWVNRGAGHARVKYREIGRASCREGGEGPSAGETM